MSLPEAVNLELYANGPAENHTYLARRLTVRLFPVDKTLRYPRLIAWGRALASERVALLTFFFASQLRGLLRALAS